jgi:hypothetical protein
MIGTTAAIIGLIASSAASSAAQAISTSHAASSAAKTQTQGAQNAMGILQGLYGQQQANLAPWMNTGTAANNLLGSLMTPPGQPGAYTPGMPMRQTPVPTGMAQLTPNPTNLVPRPSAAGGGGGIKASAFGTPANPWLTMSPSGMPSGY